MDPLLPLLEKKKKTNRKYKWKYQILIQAKKIKIIHWIDIYPTKKKKGNEFTD
jgi:hypothetical protein